MTLPSSTGFYLWYILDFGYTDVGLVMVRQEPASHLEYLRDKGSPRFYIYEAGFVTFVMYHQAHNHLPPMDENRRPIVDGYIPFDFRTVGLVPEPPLPTIPRRIPEKT